MRRVLSVFLALGLALVAAAADTQAPAPEVRLTTNRGVIVVALDAKRAPSTVANFLAYVRDGHYDGTVFHRVIPGFMIQGGGFDADMKMRPTKAPVPNEADNGLKNLRGTLAMARTMEPDSATAQFFINVADNPSLDFRERSVRGWGYAVFGHVVKGMDVVDAIAGTPTGMVSVADPRSGRTVPFQDVPKTPVVIEKAEVVAPRADRGDAVADGAHGK